MRLPNNLLALPPAELLRLARLARRHMADCMAGRGPSGYASDHMLGYVDNDAELRMIQRAMVRHRIWRGWTRDTVGDVTVYSRRVVEKNQVVTTYRYLRGE